jgi:uncharacterized membrane protein
MKSMHTRRWYNPAAIVRSLILRPRVYGGLTAGLLTYFLLPSVLPMVVRFSAACDAGGIAYLLLALRLVVSSTAENIKFRAVSRDDSRAVMLALILLAIAASVAAITGLIVHAKHPSVETYGKMLLAALAIGTIVISWSVMQVAFALHYAHDYYRPDAGSDAEHGFIFPETDVPDYWDFIYFATSIGASSQTSDTAIRSRHLRRLVTVHAALSFFFNTAVLALMVNIAASLAG